MYTIFGSTGFIGKELVTHLKKKHIKVFTPNKNQIKFNKNLGYIIYCVGSDDWLIKTQKGYFSNLGHLQKVIFNNKFKKIIFLSTTRLYINSKKQNDEESGLIINSQRANDYYNILKIASESILKNNCKNYAILRVSNVFGCNFKSPLLLPTIIRNSIKKKTTYINLSLNSSKDYIHINDLINLIFKIKKKNKYKIYNVANGQKIKLKQILNILRKLIDCKIVLKNQNKEIHEPKININRIKKEFNFKPKLSFKKSLPTLLRDFKRNLV